MQKVPTVFVRDHENTSQILWGQISDGCEWVQDGLGVPTRKFDGTCVMFDGNRWWARREVRPGKKTPANFIELNDDRNTGRKMGWIPLEDSTVIKQHREALTTAADRKVVFAPGTYELCGPKIATRAGTNPEQLDTHEIVTHGDVVITECASNDFDGLIDLCRKNGWEGVVWHHPDGKQMAKLKVRDVRSS